MRARERAAILKETRIYHEETKGKGKGKDPQKGKPGKPSAAEEP